MRVPMLVLARLCVAIGLAPGVVLAGDGERVRRLAAGVAGARHRPRR